MASSTVSASVGNANPIKILNNMNLVVSVGLLALGIMLIIYGFEIPDKPCKSKRTKNCFSATKINSKGEPKNIDDEIEMIRLIALITGFLLIIPFSLNIAEMVLGLAPGTGSLTSFLKSVGNVADQKAYSMRSRHHGGGMMHNMNKASY